MFQHELDSFLKINQKSLRKSIIDLFNEGKTEQEIIKTLKISKYLFYHLKRKFKLINPRVEKKQQQIAERIKLRKEGITLAIIANLQEVTEPAVYESIYLRNPKLVSKTYFQQFQKDSTRKRNRTRNLSAEINLHELFTYRKKGFSISAQRPNPNSNIWYVYIQKPPIQKYLGRIPQKILLLEHDLEFIKENRYLNLNPLLDRNSEKKIINQITTKEKMNHVIF